MAAMESKEPHEPRHEPWFSCTNMAIEETSAYHVALTEGNIEVVRNVLVSGEYHIDAKTDDEVRILIVLDNDACIYQLGTLLIYVICTHSLS